MTNDKIPEKRIELIASLTSSKKSYQQDCQDYLSSEYLSILNDNGKAAANKFINTELKDTFINTTLEHLKIMVVFESLIRVAGTLF